MFFSLTFKFCLVSDGAYCLFLSTNHKNLRTSLLKPIVRAVDVASDFLK